MVERIAPQNFDPREVIETIVVPDPEPTHPMAARPRATTSNEALPQPETQVGNTVAGPRILGFYLPEYTDKAREKAVEGDLIVSAHFRRDGRVRDVAVVKGLGSGLDERAIEAVKRISFEPARLGERSIDARAEIVFNFCCTHGTYPIRELSSPADLEWALMNCVIACTMVGCTAVAIGPEACVRPDAVSPP